MAGSFVSGVKGNAETEYRKGDVNITPENVGAYAKEETYSKDEIDDKLSEINNTINDTVKKSMEDMQETINNLLQRIADLEDMTIDGIIDSNGNIIVTSDGNRLIFQ